jgi:hypothetical protein
MRQLLAQLKTALSHAAKTSHQAHPPHPVLSVETPQFTNMASWSSFDYLCCFSQSKSIAIACLFVIAHGC